MKQGVVLKLGIGFTLGSGTATTVFTGLMVGISLESMMSGNIFTGFDFGAYFRSGVLGLLPISGSAGFEVGVDSHIKPS